MAPISIAIVMRIITINDQCCFFSQHHEVLTEIAGEQTKPCQIDP